MYINAAAPAMRAARGLVDEAAPVNSGRPGVVVDGLLGGFAYEVELAGAGGAAGGDDTAGAGGAAGGEDTAGAVE